MTNLELEDAFRNALIEIENEKEQVGQLTQATRSPKQMRSYLEQLQWSDKQLIMLRDTLQEYISERQEKARKEERMQTYRAKLINTARELNMSYDELLATMSDLDSRKRR
ncbi:hypothetical protein [Ferrimonas senticii]|uniref:hypothetical protein n=1 Tax=Ferrimonas senticii TaxID=394566 RepID=UPI000419C2B1|nr:hypothetical protein [Ferrimonas senticii]